MNLLEQLTFNMRPGPYYVSDDPSDDVVNEPVVRLIAFYLPQFHPIPENDTWWGKGFTEWTNVTKALPRFVGHYQPKLPGELGFYDLRNPSTLQRQAALARKYGVSGFCFHHYWFSGRRILNQPVDLLLSCPDIDMPFCLNWANESWTRRWDGNEKFVLIEQKHSVEDDIAFAQSLEPFFADPRYIRVAGRPLLIIYKPGKLPDAAATVARWRKHFIAAGFGDPYIAMTQSPGNGDADRFGLDAAVGFPPFWTGGPGLKTVTKLDTEHRGDVVDYDAMAAATIDTYDKHGKVFPGVCPSWDNEARRPGKGVCFQGSTPEKYGRWLDSAGVSAVRSLPEGERLVFINAWNEWAEGAYLEPDRHFGYAYLAETRASLGRIKSIATGSGQPMTQPAAPGPADKLTTYRRARRLARRTANHLAGILEDFAWKLRGH